MKRRGRLFIRSGRQNSPIQGENGNDSPDIAVEIISPGDTVEDVDDKVSEYLEAGALDVWVLNPRRRSVSVYSQDGRVRCLQGSEVLEGGEALPGFKMAVDEIFR